jgi:hypothetical protein
MTTNGLACPVASTNLKTLMLNFIQITSERNYASGALKRFETPSFR